MLKLDSVSNTMSNCCYGNICKIIHQWECVVNHVTGVGVVVVVVI